MIDINKLVKTLAKLSEIKVTPEKLKQIVNYIDLTELRDGCNWADIHKLIEKTNEYSVAAICIPVEHIQQALNAQLKLPIATVVNFPNGDLDLELVTTQLNQAKAQGAQEIDIVFPYQSYLAGDKQPALEIISYAFGFACDNDLLLKVIIETGAFPSANEIYDASCDLINAGCHMLKTSTGKIEHGASLEAVFAMCQAIKESNKPVGIKVSGGINSGHKAIQYMTLVEEMLEQDKLTTKQFRIGTSKLLEELNAAL